MTTLSRPTKADERREERANAERNINIQAEVIALKKKAAEWGAHEDLETISSLAGRWEALANWFPCNVVAGGVTYKSVEHAFQAAKAGADAAAAEAIRSAPTPAQAHALGQKLPLPPDWERRKVRRAHFAILAIRPAAVRTCVHSTSHSAAVLALSRCGSVR